MARLLAADIGGTKTGFGIFSLDRGPRSPLYTAEFSSKRYSDAESLIEEFLSAAGEDAAGVGAAVLGVAGPVLDNKSRLTNLPWSVDADELKRAFNLSSIRLLNDVEAMAYAVPLLKPDEISILIEGEQRPGGRVALIAPGTGLGEAFLIWEGPSPRAIAGVGGHADFAPNDSLEAGLFEYLKRLNGRVSYEHVCSGPGIFNIYDFLKGPGNFDEPEWLADRLAEAEDPTPVIVDAALDKTRPSKICSAAVDVFISILGAEAGNMALRGLTTGGVYLGGGILPRLFELLDKGRFWGSFCNKGPVSFVVEQIPVYVIAKKDAALLGAAWYGLERLQPNPRGP
jgi:glucokinase